MVAPCELVAELVWLLCLAPASSSRRAEYYETSDSRRLQDLLTCYDVIFPADVTSTATAAAPQTRSRRHAKGGEHQSDEPGGLFRVQFQALGRHFTLYLTRDTHIYAGGFEAWSLDLHGTKKRIMLSDKDLYTGHISGDLSSHATVYWERQAMVAKLETADDTYYIEPAERWLPGTGASAMLAYRVSDVRVLANSDVVNRNQSFCGTMKTAQKHDSMKDQQPLQGARKKRQVVKINSCSLFLIADYLFFRDVANSSETEAILFMVNMVNKVDTIFRRTKWSNGWTNMGFLIKKVLVHTSWSTSSSYHYNAQKSWTIDELLLALGNHTAHPEPFENFCLVHLFTGYRKFQGVLGYAHIGIPKLESGICANYLTKPEMEDEYRNVGFTTQFSRNRRLLESQGEGLLAHEFGHGWGSRHDPSSAECDPDSSDPFIMTAVSNPHPKTNGKLFSPCSIREITDVIDQKAPDCFEVVRDVNSGNYRIDGGEECDAGISGDHCCGSDFKLKTYGSCSDANHVCCRNCSTENAKDIICQFESAINCRAEARCSGSDVSCPLAFRESGSKCFPDSSGRCRMQTIDDERTTYCATLCETLGLLSCRCSEERSRCKLCCQQPGGQCFVLNRANYDSRAKPCPSNGSRHCTRDGDRFSFEPYEWSSDEITLPVDSACLIGFCNSEGVCNKQPQDSLFSIARFISTLTPSKAVQFMKENIVGTIIIFSLAFWVPVSLCVNQSDRRADQRSLQSRHDSLCMGDLTSPYLVRRNISKSNNWAGSA